jgi:hypothetical protein
LGFMHGGDAMSAQRRNGARIRARDLANDNILANGRLRCASWFDYIEAHFAWPKAVRLTNISGEHFRGTAP